MPVRIKPVHYLGRCTLSLESIKGICELMEKEFDEVSFTAEDAVWEVFNEPKDEFLRLISDRDKLDSFVADAPPPSIESVLKIEAGNIENLVIEAGQDLVSLSKATQGASKPSNQERVRLVFNEEEAKVVFDIPPDKNDWLDHFMLDLRKHILPPSLLQRFGGIPIPIVFTDASVVIPLQQPYCRIILKPIQSNQRVIGIGDNIAANIIYDVLKWVVVFLAGAAAVWLLNRYGIDILGTGT